MLKDTFELTLYQQLSITAHLKGLWKEYYGTYEP